MKKFTFLASQQDEGREWLSKCLYCACHRRGLMVCSWPVLVAGASPGSDFLDRLSTCGSLSLLHLNGLEEN